MRHRSGGSKVRIATMAGGLLLVAGLVASCSNSSGSPTTTSGSTTNSSSSNTTAGNVIKIGSISTLTGPIASDFDSFVPGIKGYLSWLNANGGVKGPNGTSYQIQLAYNLDDGGSPTTFTQLAHTLVQQDNAFAVFTSTFWFSPNLFVQTNTPTFGYNVSGNWAGPPNLFAAGGSTQDYNYGAQSVAYIVHQLKAKSIAVVSYGPAISSSYDACSTDAQKLSAAGLNVGYTDLSAQLSGDFSSAAQKMQQAGTDFVMTCMQASDNISLSRALNQYGLSNIHQVWYNGYDLPLLRQYPDLMKSVMLGVNDIVPFQAPTAYPGKYPGMVTYLAAMHQYQPQFEYSDVAIQGWMSGALLAQGIKDVLTAGQPLTQANVISAINKLTNFTAGGITTVQDWTTAHQLTQTTFPTCSAYVKVQGTTFVPTVAAPPQVFICFNKNVDLKNPTLATPQPGTPGT